MNTDDGKTIVLGELAPAHHDPHTDPVQLHYSSTTGTGTFYYHSTLLRIAQFVQTSSLVRNSGTQHNRIALHDQEAVPLEHLRELIEQIEAGHVFHFEFDPVASVWRGTAEQASSGAIFNTTVYIRWRITLVLNLINATCEYDSYSYEDTST